MNTPEEITKRGYFFANGTEESDKAYRDYTKQQQANKEIAVSVSDQRDHDIVTFNCRWLEFRGYTLEGIPSETRSRLQDIANLIYSGSRISRDWPYLTFYVPKGNDISQLVTHVKSIVYEQLVKEATPKADRRKNSKDTIGQMINNWTFTVGTIDNFAANLDGIRRAG